MRKDVLLMINQIFNRRFSVQILNMINIYNLHKIQIKTMFIKIAKVNGFGWILNVIKSTILIKLEHYVD